MGEWPPSRHVGADDVTLPQTELECVTVKRMAARTARTFKGFVWKWRGGRISPRKQRELPPSQHVRAHDVTLPQTEFEGPTVNPSQTTDSATFKGFVWKLGGWSYLPPNAKPSHVTWTDKSHGRVPSETASTVHRNLHGSEL